MLRINSRGAAASANYYTKVISKSYHGEENPGFMHGESAVLLGYAEGQEIDPAEFVKLCYSINPFTEE